MVRRNLPWTALLVVALAGGAFWIGGFGSGNPAGLPARPELAGLPPALEEAINAAEARVRRGRNDPQLWTDLGQLYHANGFTAEAQASYQSALATGTAAPRVYYFLADLAESAGDLDEASRWLRESVHRAPFYGPAYVRLGDILYKAGEADAAVAAYEKARQLHPNHPFALVGLAREHLRTGDLSRARELLESLTVAHPKFGLGWNLLAQVLDRQGEATRARDIRARHSQVKDAPPEDPWMEEVRRLCHDGQRLGFYFEDAFGQGRLPQAMQYLDRMEALDPKDWNAPFLRAHAYSLMQRRAEAVPLYEKAIALGGDPARIYGELVDVLLELNRQEAAENAVRAGLAAGARTPALLLAQGRIDLRHNRPTEAARRFEAVLALDADHVAANMALAQIHWAGAERVRAIPYLQTVQRIAPAHVASRALLGQYFLEQHEPAEAIAPLAQAATLEPGNVEITRLLTLAYLRRGNQQAKAGDFSAAIASYDQALRLDPQNIEGRANTVQVLMHLKAFAQAEEALQPLLQLQPGNPTVHLTLGDIHQAAGRRSAARASWTRASDLLGPNTDETLRRALAARLESPVAD